MRLLKAFVAASAAGLVTLATAAPALAQDVPTPLPTQVPTPTPTDPSSVTDLIPFGDSQEDGGSQQQELQVTITDGTFTSADPEITFEVTNCESNEVDAESSIFAGTSYAPDTKALTATIAEGTESGTYEVTFTCAGEPDLTRKIEISKTSPSPSPSPSDEDQTTEVPEGGVQTGGGGTADGVPAAGWALLPLAAAPALIALRRRGARE